VAQPPDVYPFRFHCQRSGNCCARPEGVVEVGPADIARIAKHLRLSQEAVRARFVTRRGDRLIDAPGGRCVFLVDGREAACGIYPARPRQCRSWPFWPELLRSPEALREARRLCPGIQPLAADAAGAAQARPPDRAGAG
jgi:Fe-S-cluster containining protein